MNAIWPSVLLLAFTPFVVCRDFYLGMFRRNDFLVAQDVLYKAPSPFGSTTASYGRVFKCPITYFRVVDRLGMGRGPITTIVRGGLKKKIIAVRIKSTYRLPVSVNIYVGCENKQPSTFRTTSVTLNTTFAPDSDSTLSTNGSENIVFPDTSDEDDKSKPTEQTTDKQPGDEKDNKDPDDDNKDEDTATTAKENNEDTNNNPNPEEEEEKAEEE